MSGNIWSGAKGIYAALTNPTELAFRKGSLRHHYPVHYNAIDWPDAESAYQRFKIGHEFHDDGLMINVIAAKLEQHRRLLSEVIRLGGAAWLAECSHWATGRNPSWEGDGMGSRFIRNLIVAYGDAYKRCCRVVHCKREPYDVLIARPNAWGNPYKIGRDGDREKVIELYEKHLLADRGLMDRLWTLRGQTLGCWCAPEACHGDVLLRYANRKDEL